MYVDIMTNMKQITKQLKKSAAEWHEELKFYFSEEQQLKHDKQFRYFAPQWYEELKIPLKYHQKPDNPKLNLQSYDGTIPGELHGFSNIYMIENFYNYCPECVEFAQKIVRKRVLKRNSFIIYQLMKHVNRHVILRNHITNKDEISHG